MQLFRREALEARRQTWLGGISLAQPLRLWVLGLCMSLAALAIGVFLALGSYTRRAHVAGQLVPDLGLSTVVAPSDGIVERIYHREGERVLSGAALALVAIPRATADGNHAQASIAAGIERRRESLEAKDASQAALAAAQAAGYRAQLEAARLELTQAGVQVESLHRQVALARDTLERYRALAQGHYVSELQVRQEQQAVFDRLDAQRQIERQATALQRQVAQLEQALRELPAQRAAQAAATARDLALLENERVRNEASGELLVQAPVAGLLASQLVEPGQAVRAGQPLSSVLPAGSRLRAQLVVPSRAIGFIRTGDRVLLRYQAYPYQKFGHQGGVVASISRNALGGAEPGALAGNAQAVEPYYRILVDIDRQSVLAYGREQPLRPGMLLDADIFGEHRKLYEWALEPLYSLTGRL